MCLVAAYDLTGIDAVSRQKMIRRRIYKGHRGAVFQGDGEFVVAILPGAPVFSCRPASGDRIDSTVGIHTHSRMGRYDHFLLQDALLPGEEPERKGRGHRADIGHELLLQADPGTVAEGRFFRFCLEKG